MDLLPIIQQFLSGLNLNPWSLVTYLMGGGIAALIWFIVDKYAILKLAKYLPAGFLVNKLKTALDSLANIFERFDDEVIDKIKERLPTTGAYLQSEIIDLLSYIITRLTDLKKKISD